MYTITRKIELFVDGDNKDESWKLIREIDYHLFKVANKVVNALYLGKEVANRIKLAEGCKIAEARKKAAVLYQANSCLGIAYNVTKEYDWINSEIRGALAQKVYKDFNNDAKELFIGKRSVRTYRKGLPIPAKERTFNIIKAAGEYRVKWVSKIKFGFVFGRDKSNNKEIVNRVFEGKYKMLGSAIQVKGKRLFLLMTVQIPKEERNLDKNLVVGIDLGINIPLYAALNKGEARMSIGSREEFLNQRLYIQRRKRELQRALKWTKGGKGRKKKLKALENIQQRERNFVNTKNHIYSRAIINFALKNNAGKIRMENLSGIGKNEKASFILRNWSYFELQRYIEEKAERVGIEVEKINPAYTSQMCSSCGHVARDNRESQSKFICQSCENEMNADYNAALNIANYDEEKFKLEVSLKG